VSVVVKLTFLFNPPADPAAFDQYFFERHLALHAGIRNIQRREIARVLGTPDGSEAPYHLIAEYYFETMDALMEDFSSEGGQALNRDLGNFAEAGFTAIVSQIEDA
jgi:uncharacterized protein (TIGR02118 family)